MKKSVLLITFLVGISTGVHAQNESRIGLSIHSDFFPEFRIHEADLTQSSAYGFQLSFYDMNYTRLRFSFHYARGYHQTVSYSAGLSAGYVISISDRISLTPGLGGMNYKMADRTCRISFRSIMNTIFNVDEHCPDDSHGSLNLFLSSELELTEPFSIFFQTGYRMMHNSVRRLEGTETETLPGGGTIERNYYKRENFFHDAGFEFGIGLKINLF